MTVSRPTLDDRLSHADALHRAARWPAARAAWESLVESAQEAGDRSLEVVARAMLARCLLQLRDLDAAREELDRAEARTPRAEGAESRLQGARARLRMSVDEDRGRSALLAYHAWAVGAGDAHAAVDACRLLGALGPADERVDWLERAVDHATGDDAESVDLYRDLAAALDVLDRSDEALEAAEKALEAAQRTGDVRAVVGSAWGAGALAMRLDAPETARQHLDLAIHTAAGREDCEDLLGFTLGARAELEADSGDVPEARRLMVKALRIAADLDFANAAPVQWAQMSGLARRLELDED